jgi:hypothetical protein
VAYTAADRDAVKAAKLALATGTRVVTVQFADHSVTYQQANLGDLDALLIAIEAELAAATSPPRPRSWLLYASKGT